MQKHFVWLWVVGFFGLVVATDAQTPSPPAVTAQFDGTYAFVASTRVNETYTITGSNRFGQCDKMKIRRASSRARGQTSEVGVTLETKERFEGTGRPQGELSLRL